MYIFKPFSPIKPRAAEGPYITVTIGRINFPDPRVIESLGNPEYLAVEVDASSKALKLTKVEASNPEGRPYKPARLPRPGEKTGTKAAHINSSRIDEILPTGSYTPLGGGVFTLSRHKITKKERNKQ